MQYSILGNTGPVDSRLAFGAMAFTAGIRLAEGLWGEKQLKG
jgi:hypothetical protein